MNFVQKHFGRLGNSLFQYAYIYSQFRDGAIPDIFVQDPKYFDKYGSEIRQLFGDGIGNDERVAIHVRRGDYVGNSFYVDLTKTTYYADAISQFPNEKFVVFSDDIEFCKKYFDSRFEFSEGKTVEEDLKAMASCKGMIMANSSLSWWGGFLGNPNKKVVYPKEWFSDKIQRVGFLKEWYAI